MPEGAGPAKVGTFEFHVWEAECKPWASILGTWAPGPRWEVQFYGLRSWRCMGISWVLPPHCSTPHCGSY